MADESIKTVVVPAFRMELELYREVSELAKKNYRKMPGQIKYLMGIGLEVERLFKENKDLNRAIEITSKKYRTGYIVDEVLRNAGLDQEQKADSGHAKNGKRPESRGSPSKSKRGAGRH